MGDRTILPDHRKAAMALLISGVELRQREGQFLGGIAHDPKPLTERQSKWLAVLRERHGFADSMPEGSADRPAQWLVLDKMRHLRESDPADQLWAAALTALARAVVDLRPILTADQQQALIAIGSLIMPLANAEVQANTDAKNVLERAQGMRRG